MNCLLPNKSCIVQLYNSSSDFVSRYQCADGLDAGRQLLLQRVGRMVSKGRHHAQGSKPKRSQAEASEIVALEQRIAAGAPEPGTMPGSGAGPDGPPSTAAGAYHRAVVLGPLRMVSLLHPAANTSTLKT